MPKVSVIVPVYKVEKYLSRCVESIISQTYTNWEILLIDDGSPDRSGTICDEYAANDSRIRVFHKENGGVSTARNVGLDNMTGDYFTFLDSDDYLDITTLQNLINTISTYPSAEVVDFPILRDAGSRDNEKLDAVSNIVVNTSISEIDYYWFFNPRFESCARLFRSDKLGNIRFNPRLRIGEDTVFFMHYLMRCTTMVAIPNGLYAYCYRESSAMGAAQVDKLIANDLLMLELMGEKVWERPILAAILYRMIIPKLQEHKIKLGEVIQYEPYLSKIEMMRLLKSYLPLKAKIIVLLMKLMVIVC